MTPIIYGVLIALIDNYIDCALVKDHFKWLPNEGKKTSNLRVKMVTLPVLPSTIHLSMGPMLFIFEDQLLHLIEILVLKILVHEDQHHN